MGRERICKLPEIPFRISMIRDAVPPALTCFFSKRVWYGIGVSRQRAVSFLLCANASFSRAHKVRPLHVM